MIPIAAKDISEEIHVGPFHARQRELGATFYEDYGTLWTASFGDPVSEYWAIRRDVGLWDTSALVKYHVTGSDTLTALTRLFTRRLVDAPPGTVRYGMLLDQDGLMLDEATVAVLSDDEAYLFGNDGEASFSDHMSSHTRGMDVQFANVSNEIPCLAVQGPRSFNVMQQLTGVGLESIPWFRCLPEPIQIHGVKCLLVRAGFTGELGYELYLLDGPDGAEQLWDVIAAAGATPVGLDAIQMIRVEAGLLIAEEDYFPGQTDPLDLGMERFIDLDGHDFVGREALIARLSNPSRRFVTLRLAGENAPPGGSTVEFGGEVVGEVRSAYTTPRYGTLALSVVDTQHSEPGTRVLVQEREGVVHPVPIDDPRKLRPRSDPHHPLVAT